VSPRADRCVLVGLPGSGKSTVGPVLARTIGWEFFDFDDEIVLRAGCSVANLFQERGEAAFRAMEAQLTAELSSLPRVVLAPGGGWAAQPGLLESLPRRTAVIWLRVSPEEAIRRLRGSPVVRPLLTGADALGVVRWLERERNDRYARADLVVDVDGLGPDEISETISEWLKPDIS
jgi:shikimate kinase